MKAAARSSAASNVSLLSGKRVPSVCQPWKSAASSPASSSALVCPSNGPASISVSRASTITGHPPVCRSAIIWAVTRARSSGEAKMRSMPTAASVSAASLACATPASLSGTSLRVVKRPSAFQTVSAWRISISRSRTRSGPGRERLGHAPRHHHRPRVHHQVVHLLPVDGREPFGGPSGGPFGRLWHHEPPRAPAGQPLALVLGEGEAHQRLVAGEGEIDDPPHPELDPPADVRLVGARQ